MSARTGVEPTANLPRSHANPPRSREKRPQQHLPLRRVMRAAHDRERLKARKPTLERRLRSPPPEVAGRDMIHVDPHITRVQPCGSSIRRSSSRPDQLREPPGAGTLPTAG